MISCLDRDHRPMGSKGGRDHSDGKKESSSHWCFEAEHMLQCIGHLS